MARSATLNSHASSMYPAAQAAPSAADTTPGSARGDS